jgi:hypothetical protein
MIKLHGLEVKVGDRVWSIGQGWLEIHSDLTSHGRTVSISELSATNDIFWQPISPEAIEAAKRKPKEPEYEWQWLYFDVIEERFITTQYYQENITPNVVRKESLSRIEESKRLVSHE